MPDTGRFSLFMTHAARRAVAACLLDAAGLSREDAQAFIAEAEAAATRAAQASVRPNETVFVEVFESLVDRRANGDPDGSKQRAFDAGQTLAESIAAARGIAWK